MSGWAWPAHRCSHSGVAGTADGGGRRLGLPWMLTRSHRHLAPVTAETRDPVGFARLEELAEVESAKRPLDTRIAACESQR